MSFNQGDKWKALISRYIGTIPPSGVKVRINSVSPVVAREPVTA